MHAPCHNVFKYGTTISCIGPITGHYWRWLRYILLPSSQGIRMWEIIWCTSKHGSLTFCVRMSFQVESASSECHLGESSESLAELSYTFVMIFVHMTSSIGVNIGSDNGLSPVQPHYLNQSWLTVGWTAGKKLQWSSSRVMMIFILKILFKMPF